jgi:hypothetical protein
LELQNTQFSARNLRGIIAEYSLTPSAVITESTGQENFWSDWGSFSGQVWRGGAQRVRFRNKNPQFLGTAFDRRTSKTAMVGTDSTPFNYPYLCSPSFFWVESV